MSSYQSYKSTRNFAILQKAPLNNFNFFHIPAANHNSAKRNTSKSTNSPKGDETRSQNIKEKPAYMNQITVQLKIGDFVPYYISHGYVKLESYAADMCWKSGK